MGECAGNVALSSRLTGLPKDSVANVSQIVTLDRSLLTELVGLLPREDQKMLHPVKPRLSIGKLLAFR